MGRAGINYPVGLVFRGPGETSGLGWLVRCLIHPGQDVPGPGLHVGDQSPPLGLRRNK